MLKYLRIAVTALSLTACVLLIALWLRSYYRLETMRAWPGHTISSMKGRLFVDGRFIQDESSGAHRELRFFAGTSIPIPGGAADLRPQTTGIPIWFFSFGAASLGAALWIRWSNRFSLRTLLIATTLVAVALGAVIYAAT